MADEGGCAFPLPESAAKRKRANRMLRSDITNILATGAHDGVGKMAVVTVDETEGRITITLCSSRTIYQRFHVFVVEES
jgi:hypothetical protein